MDRQAREHMLKEWQALFRSDVERHPELAQSSNYQVWAREDLPSVGNSIVAPILLEDAPPTPLLTQLRTHLTSQQARIVGVSPEHTEPGNLAEITIDKPECKRIG